MCGIVGYYGAREPKKVILDGLKKLEYRGYDSAGVAILNEGKYKIVRAPGKLKELEVKLADEKFDGNIGIGHTRWATHGVPNEKNAHPHAVDGVCIIANGIIENYLQIREDLLSRNRTIKSDTDSELVAHLIAEELVRTPDLKKAVEKVYPLLHGAFAILAVWDQQPDQIIAFKNGPPLIAGIGNGEAFFASDILAIVPYTNKVVYLEDEEMALITHGQIQFFTTIGSEIKKQIVEVTWNAQVAEKQGYKHYMLKEIFEQPRAVAAAFEPHLDLQNKKIRLSGMTEEGLQKIQSLERIYVVACGTSFYAGMVGEYLFEQTAKIPVEVEYASEFRYRHPVISKNSLVIVISQSGETADTLAALKLAKEKGATVLSICNVRNSTIDREAHLKFYMNSGPEIGVASTKAFTSTLSLLNVLSIAFGKIRNSLSDDQEKELIEKLLIVPSQMESVLAYDSFFTQAAETLKKYKGYLYIGRGVSFPIALEGALKLKELAYMHAEGYAAGEMKHGPIALIDEKMAVVVVAPTDEVLEKTVSNLEEVRARGGQVISIGTTGNKKLQGLSVHYIGLPQSQWMMNPLLAVIPLQLLAYHVADALGYDVDQPRNLAKSVTVE